jgi:hypothetical protein
LFQQNILPSFQKTFEQKWYRFLILLALWTFMSSIWSPHFDHEAWFNLKKVLKLLCIPLFILGFQDHTQKDMGLKLFVWASLIPCSLSFMKYFFQIDWHDPQDPGHVFYNHILTGFIASFAAYLALEIYLKERVLMYIGIWAILSIQVLGVNTGRLAYLLYTVLMMYSIWFQTPKKIRMGAVMFGFGLACVVISISPSCQMGFKNLLQDIQQFQLGNKATSLGFRVQFHHFAYQLFQKHYLVGNGPGSYVYWFKELNPVPQWTLPPNSHSQYWLILSEEGLIGLFLWLSFMFSTATYAFSKSWYGKQFCALMLILTINSFTDNIFFAAPGYLFLALSAIGLQSTPEEKT